MEALIIEFLTAIEIFIVAVAVAALVALPSIRLAERSALIDVPGSSDHKRHKQPTPIAGGIVLVACFTALFFIFGAYFSSEAKAILGCSLIIFVFGLWDDRKGLNAPTKFSGQLIALVVLVYSGVQVSILKVPGTSIDEMLNLLITAFWIIGITNAFNIIDSADGLAPSLALLSASFLLIGAILASQPQLIYQASALIGVGSVILYLNVSPAQLFLGDSGAQTMGFLLASLAILYNPQVRPQSSSWFVPITFLALPIFDVCLVFFSRLRHGKPFYKSDRHHTYHRLVRSGLAHGQVVVLIAFTALLVGLIGLFALYQEPVAANILFGSLIVFGVIVFFFMERLYYE